MLVLPKFLCTYMQYIYNELSLHRPLLIPVFGAQFAYVYECVLTMWLCVCRLFSPEQPAPSCQVSRQEVLLVASRQFSQCDYPCPPPPPAQTQDGSQAEYP
jgi:hypothetical protein